MSALSVVFFVLAPVLVLALILYCLRDEFAANRRLVAVIALACLAFFHRIVFFGEALSQSDANLLQLQFFTAYRSAILDFAEIPFWNPLVGAGVPNLANPLSAMFYPLAPLFLATNVFRAMSVFVVCHYFLAGTFALFVGRRIFRAAPAALVFAIVYAFNGWAVTRSAHQPAIEYLFAYTWLPLVVLAFERAVDGKSILSSIVAAGAGLAWMGMTCPNLFVYASILLVLGLAARLAVLAALRRTNAFAAGLSAAVGAAIFALALGAVEYGPARELAQFSTSTRLGSEYPGGWRTRGLSIWMIAKLYSPYAPGRPFGVYYSPGAVAILLALVAVYAAIRLKLRRTLVGAAFLVLLFGAALAAKTPLYAALARASKLVALASLMPACLILLVLPVAVLAAAGVDALAGQYKRLSGRGGWLLPALVFVELFVGFAVIYPRWGERRLTFDYAKEVADFPHLDIIAAEGSAGRIFVQSPTEGQILAPSYAVLPRRLSRINLHPSDFAPDWLTEALGAPLTTKSLSALGVGWVASTEPVIRPGEQKTVSWPSVDDHYEDNVFFPLRNRAGWVAWDRTVHLCRLSVLPAIARAEPLTKRSMIQEHSQEPLASLETERLDTFADWNAITVVSETTNSLTLPLPESAPARYFFAVTAYPGWRVAANGVNVPWVTAAGAFIAADVPQKTTAIELHFRPTHWSVYMFLAAAAVAFTIVAAARQSR